MNRSRQPSRNRRPWALVLLLAAVVARPAVAWELEDRFRVADVSHAVPSPDGKRVAYVVSRAAAAAPPGVFRGQLFVAAADGSGARQFTFGDTQVSAPAWSPDGAWIAYLERAPGEPDNLAIIRDDGGGGRPLTGFAEGVNAFQWSPTGDALALLRPDPAAPGDRLAVVAGRPEPPHHLWHLPVDDAGVAATPRRLTGGDFHVGSALLDGAFDWAPDGRAIAFTRTRSARPDDWTTADIAIVAVSDGNIRAFQTSNAAEYAPRYSPDGVRIAFNITVYPPSWIRQSRIGLARADGNGLKLLAATADEQPTMIGWITDRTVLVAEDHRTTTALWLLPADGGRPRRFDPGGSVITSARLNEPGTRLALVTMDHDTPPEASVTPLRRFRPVAVSAANAAAPPLPAVNTEVIRWQSDDGLEVEGLLTLPAGQERGVRHPLLLLIHGGPADAFRNDYLGHPRSLLPLATLAARGYATLRPNPRGSSGYGHPFRAANRGDWGGADHRDLMRGVDHLIDQGIADPARLGVAGWSYGGYLSALTVTRTHRFAAAMAGAPATDLLQISTTGDLRGFVPAYLGGDYWTQPDLYRDRSPLHHAAEITTPMLILHGADDTRVPAAQGLALFQALQRQGLATRLVTYPGAGHVPDDPAQIRHAAQEIVDWFDRYLAAP